MDPSAFRDAGAGRLVPIGTGVHAFVPANLPTRLTLGDPTVVALADAERALGELNGLGRLLPEPYLLIDAALAREAVESSRIEGTHASVADLLLREASPQVHLRDDVQEVVNYAAAMRHGLRRLGELPLCLNLVRELRAVLTEGGRGESRALGEFRRVQNHIGPPGSRLEDARYVPPPVPEMTRLLDDWEKALHVESGMPALVRCAITHCQFEAIHPFLDGNGRVGRLVAVLFLIERNVLRLPLLNLAAHFEADRQAYYDGLLAVSTDGAWDQWVRYFLRGIAAQAAAAVADSERLLSAREQLRRRLVGARARPTALRLTDVLFINPYVTAQHVAQRLSVSEPSAQSAIRQLVDMGILREVTGQKRRRVYLADDVLRAIEAGSPRTAPS